MGFKEDQQRSEVYLILGAVILSLSLFLYKCYEQKDQNTKDIHRYYDCVFDEMYEGKDELDAKKHCSNFEMEMQEALHEYGEHLKDQAY